MAARKRNKVNVTKDFYDFAFIPKFDDIIISLAELADDEDWDYKNIPTGKSPILVNYLK